MTDDAKHRRRRLAKIAFGVMALVSVLIGLAIYVFADAMGLGQQEASLIAIAFLLAGVVDYIILRNWDRLTGGRE